VPGVSAKVYQSDFYSSRQRDSHVEERRREKKKICAPKGGKKKSRR